MTYELRIRGARGELQRGHGAMWVLVEDAVALGMAFPSRPPPFSGVDHLRAHEGDTPGIPAHKLRSNNGWHVTREECVQALATYDEAVAGGAAHPESFREDLVPFLRTAAAHDGFEVL